MLLLLTMSCKFLPFGLGKSVPQPTSQNEPADLQKLANRPYDNLTEDNWIFGGDQGAYLQMDDASAPFSPTHIGRVTIPKGFESGASPIHFEKNLSPSDRVYVHAYFRLSDNWQRNPIDDGLVNLWAGDQPRIYWGWRGDQSDNTMHPAALVSTPSADGGSVWLDANLVQGLTISRGAWHNVEFLIDSKGTYDCWLDGTKIAHYDNVPYHVLEEGRHWDLIQVGPAWGGLTPPLDQSQTVDFDHVYVSGK
jgi:hypothetical protein